MNKQDIKNILAKHYKYETVRKLIEGRCLPSLKKALQLQEDGIPIHFWKDIKSYVNENIPTCNDTKKVQETKI